VVPWHNFVLREPAGGGPVTVSTELVLGAQDDIAERESIGVFEDLRNRMWASG
jgi:hypothetical protein